MFKFHVEYLDLLPSLQSLDFQANDCCFHGNRLPHLPPCRHPLMNYLYDFVFLSADQINRASFPQLMVHNYFEMNSILLLRDLFWSISRWNDHLLWELLSEINVSSMYHPWYNGLFGKRYMRQGIFT